MFFDSCYKCLFLVKSGICACLLICADISSSLNICKHIKVYIFISLCVQCDYLPCLIISPDISQWDWMAEFRIEIWVVEVTQFDFLCKIQKTLCTLHLMEGTCIFNSECCPTMQIHSIMHSWGFRTWIGIVGQFAEYILELAQLILLFPHELSFRAKKLSWSYRKQLE